MQRISLTSSEKIEIAGAFLLIAAGVFMQAKMGAMGDKGWLLLATERWLAGQHLYTDIFEVNPPLIIWLYAVPCWLSHHIPIGDYALMACMGIAAVAMNILACARLLARHPAFAQTPYRIFLLALLLALICIPFTSPIYFFDRENIMLVMTLPYLLRFMPSLVRVSYPLRLRLLIGVMAAIGFSIKPHAVLLFIAFQLVFLLRERSAVILKSTENRVIYGWGVVYFISIALFSRDYFTTVLPLALATYADFGVKGSAKHFMPLAFLALTVPLVDFQPRHATPYRRDVYHFILVPLLFAAYALTNNGWGYTFDPIFSTLTIYTAWLWWEYDWLKHDRAARGLPVRQFSYGKRSCTVCLGIYLLTGSLNVVGSLSVAAHDGYVDSGNNDAYVKYFTDRHVQSFGLMSGEFTRWPQISGQSHASWVTRFNHLWMVPALANAGRVPEPERSQAVGYVSKAYAEDMERNRPQVMIIDNSDEFFTYPVHVDLLKLLGGSPEFKAAWSHYRFDTTLDFCTSDRKNAFPQKVGCRYDIYRRIDSP